MRPEPLCSPRARCYTLRFVGVPAATCAYCYRAERLVNLWERIRTVAQIGVLMVALLGCRSSRGMQARDAGDVDAGDVHAWLCFCGGSRAITCTQHEPICSATDPSERVAKSEGTTCSCREQGACVRDADCIEVR